MATNVSNLLKNLGITTPEAATALASEMRKAANGEYGYVDMVGGVHTRESLGIQKDATNQIGVVTGLGLLGVPLEVPAKLLYPVPTLLVNRLPRETVGGASVTFRKITAINSTNVWGSVAEASDSTTGRNTRIAFNEANITYNFKTIEMETMLTPEALFGSNSKITPGQDFQAADISRLTLLQATKLAEEKMLLGGNVTLLAAVATPTIASPVGLATGIGSLTAATAYYLRVSALTLQGWLGGSTGRAAADALGETPATNEMTRTTAAGGQVGDKSFNAHWTAIPGAVAYNVFVGTTTGNANCQYVGTVFTTAVTVLSVTRIAATYNTDATMAPNVSSTNVGNTLDKTANALDFDGLIAQCTKTAFGPGYYLALVDGATLTGDSTGGVNELDVAFKSFFDTYKSDVDEIFVNTTQKKKIDQISVGSSAPVYRIDATAGDLNIKGSLGVRSVMNRYFGDEVPVTVHPFLPPGTILFVNYALGPYYPGSNVGDNIKIFLGWDYRAIDFTAAKRAQETGMDLSEALVVHANFTLGAIQCVA
jgi:hypothetical protein